MVSKGQERKKKARGISNECKRWLLVAMQKGILAYGGPEIELCWPVTRLTFRRRAQAFVAVRVQKLWRWSTFFLVRLLVVPLSDWSVLHGLFP